MSLRLQCNNLRLQLSKAAIRRLLLSAPGAAVLPENSQDCVQRNGIISLDCYPHNSHGQYVRKVDGSATSV